MRTSDKRSLIGVHFTSKFLPVKGVSFQFRGVAELSLMSVRGGI